MSWGGQVPDKARYTVCRQKDLAPQKHRGNSIIQICHQFGPENSRSHVCLSTTVTTMPLFKCTSPGCLQPGVRRQGSCRLCHSHLCTKHLGQDFHHCPDWRVRLCIPVKAYLIPSSVERTRVRHQICRSWNRGNDCFIVTSECPRLAWSGSGFAQSWLHSSNTLVRSRQSLLCNGWNELSHPHLLCGWSHLALPYPPSQYHDYTCCSPESFDP